MVNAKEVFKGALNMIADDVFKRPKVSVCVVTYNQEKYITECLQGIVDQETDFYFEVIVSDDCSTDRTREIIQLFSERHPNITVLFRSENLGALRNFVDTHGQATGEYVCHCDGDDYWLPGKLQAQVDYLDRHPYCNIVWHRMRIEDLSSSRDINRQSSKSENVRRYTRKDILLIGSIGRHSSKMYRSGYVSLNPLRHQCIDFFTDVEHVGDGYAVALDECYGVYRGGVGISSQGDGIKNMFLSHQNFFMKKFPEYRGQIAANVFLVFLVDLKNGRKTWRRALGMWVRANLVLLCINLLKLFRIARDLRKDPR